MRDDTYYGDFSILISKSKRATKGRHSDPAYDKRSEYSYSDAREVVAFPENQYYYDDDEA